ncbi:hypothetical protein VB711_18420 [Cronbergia sp. UHCC 0137]|uniref:hypothetical protein n=1 Tax=Cronbergia sp. UHCC 0137 TaxID=3110239 RepID=UPI002B20C750|nr:hypothetical protein [Cronbergia sp. UHCC 0137]MEA5619802.1 hypothetical protein [Cronbergia sp. UHCC 0137]
MELLIFGLGAIYLLGIWRFWAGFQRTHFDKNLINRISLGLLWPALFIVNKSYRRNFKRALKG